MSDTYLADLNEASHWIKSRDPDWRSMPTPSFQRHINSTENSFLTRTLHTENGIRAWQTYVKRTRHPRHGNPVTQALLEQRVLQEGDVVMEVLALISLGNGVDGIPHVCHGGVISTLLDETACLVATEIFGRYNNVSAGLNVAFKRSVMTPTVLVCRAYLSPGNDTEIRERKKTKVKSGRQKLLVESRIEDLSGQIYATAAVVCVTRVHKL